MFNHIYTECILFVLWCHSLANEIKAAQNSTLPLSHCWGDFNKPTTPFPPPSDHKSKPNKISNKLRFGDYEAKGVESAELINSVFLRIVNECQPLEPALCPPDFTVPDDFLLSIDQVYWKLSNLSTKKSYGPESIPSTMLRHLSMILAPPLTNIFNSCLMEGAFSAEWKCGGVCSGPTKTKVIDIENDLRPISLISPV